MQTQQHLLIKQGDIGEFVLLPGDPERVNFIGTFLEKAKIIANNREFRTVTGYFRGIRISAISTGIGSPSTAIACEEAINAGAKFLIRTGTCGGSWSEKITRGSLIVPTASVRDEGTTKEYILPEFPAVADFDIVSALKNAAIKNKSKFYLGINRTHDAFYGADSSIKKWGTFFKDNRFKAYDTPIISSEMETSALFVISSIRGAKAGAILAVDASPTPLKQRVTGSYFKMVTFDNEKNRKTTIRNMVKTALDAIFILNQQSI